MTKKFNLTEKGKAFSNHSPQVSSISRDDRIRTRQEGNADNPFGRSEDTQNNPQQKGCGKPIYDGINRCIGNCGIKGYLCSECKEKSENVCECGPKEWALVNRDSGLFCVNCNKYFIPKKQGEKDG